MQYVRTAHLMYVLTLIFHYYKSQDFRPVSMQRTNFYFFFFSTDTLFYQCMVLI